MIFFVVVVVVVVVGGGGILVNKNCDWDWYHSFKLLCPIPLNIHMFLYLESHYTFFPVGSVNSLYDFFWFVCFSSKSDKINK